MKMKSLPSKPMGDNNRNLSFQASIFNHQMNQTMSKNTKLKQLPYQVNKNRFRRDPKDLYLKYKDKNGEWHNARIISRAGKVGGRHGGWFNVETETGMWRAINFSNIKDIEVDDDPPEVTLITNTAEVLTAKSKELPSWKDQSVYIKVPDRGQECMSLKWVVTPKVIDGKPSVKARLVSSSQIWRNSEFQNR